MTNFKYLLKTIKMVQIYTEELEEFTKTFSNFLHRKVLPLFTNIAQEIQGLAECKQRKFHLMSQKLDRIMDRRK